MLTAELERIAHSTKRTSFHHRHLSSTLLAERTKQYYISIVTVVLFLVSQQLFPVPDSIHFYVVVYFLTDGQAVRLRSLTESHY